jgi:hypothetical protein
LNDIDEKSNMKNSLSTSTIRGFECLDEVCGQTFLAREVLAKLPLGTSFKIPLHERLVEGKVEVISMIPLLDFISRIFNSTEFRAFFVVTLSQYINVDIAEVKEFSKRNLHNKTIGDCPQSLLSMVQEPFIDF